MPNKTFSLTNSERILLELIWQRGPIARTELSTITGLTEATISRLARELIQREFLAESVSREGFKGQPKRPLMVAAGAAFAFGVYFSRHYLEVGVVDLNGRLLTSRVRPLRDPTVDHLAEVSRSAIDDILKRAPVDPTRVLGVGFSLPGDFIGSGAKINAHALFPELMHVDLQIAMTERLPFPVFVENDAASAALGERIHGVGRHFDHFLFIHLGHGIGGGIVIDGKLYRGACGNAGIIGVQFPNGKPRPSGQDLLATLLAHDIELADLDALGQLSPRTCAPLKSWIRRAGGQLAGALDVTARILDPHAIVLGGRFPLTLLQELVSEIDKVGFCQEGVMLPRPKLVASSLGPTAGVTGSACLAFREQLFSKQSPTAPQPDRMAPR